MKLEILGYFEYHIDVKTVDVGPGPWPFTLEEGKAQTS